MTDLFPASHAVQPEFFFKQLFFRGFIKNEKTIEKELTEILLITGERKTSAEIVKVIKNASFSDLRFIHHSNFFLLLLFISASTQERFLNFIKNHVVLDSSVTSARFHNCSGILPRRHNEK